jgi:hypothetical protein
VAQSDAVAWLQLLYARPKRVLARPFLQILVRRPAAGAGAGAAPTAGAGAPSAAGVASAGAAAPVAYDDGPLGGGASGGGGRAVADATGFAEVVLAELNRVRVQAGLGAVKLSAAQSAVAARVAGHYFVAAEAGGGTSSGGGGGGGEEMDRIALGLLAGWQVGGMIRDGQFLSWLVPHTRDPARWLASALAMPLGRATLLAREIEEVALGPLVLDKPEALGAVVTGYRFHRESDHAADIRRLYQRLLTARKRLGLKLPARLEGMDRVLAAELARVHAGKAEPANAMQAVLQIGVDQFGGGMRGYVIETTSLDALEIPEQIVRQPTLHLEIGVTHHKPAGAAWAQLVIVVIFADYGPDQGGQRI